jgi:hypothetical protein
MEETQWKKRKEEKADGARVAADGTTAREVRHRTVCAGR